jgi:hypothetical protein
MSFVVCLCTRVRDISKRVHEFGTSAKDLCFYIDNFETVLILVSDTDFNRVPDELTSLTEVWYLDGSSIFKNNSLGKENGDKV